MFRKALLIFILTFTTVASADELKFINGKVTAHTEVFGESAINPSVSDLSTNIHISGDITSIKGTITIPLIGLKSDNSKRDAHMQEVLESNKFPNAVYTITNIEKDGNGFKINGILNLHNVKNTVAMKGSIENAGPIINIKVDGAFPMSSFGIEPPRLLFLKVRDSVDISGNLSLSK